MIEKLFFIFLFAAEGFAIGQNASDLEEIFVQELIMQHYTSTCISHALESCNSSHSADDINFLEEVLQMISVNEEIHGLLRSLTSRYDLLVPLLPDFGTKNTLENSYPLHCAEFRGRGYPLFHVADIFPNPDDPKWKISVNCDQATDGGGWTLVQSRDVPYELQNKEVAFGKAGLDDFKKGFEGKNKKVFWIGLNALHHLTYRSPTTLRIELEDYEGNKGYAEYEDFKVGPESEEYPINVGDYSGNAGNSLIFHNGGKFSKIPDSYLYDAIKNYGAKDLIRHNYNALKGMGFFWESNTGNRHSLWANLNAPAKLVNPIRSKYLMNVNKVFWYKFATYKPIKTSKMMVRPINP